MKVFKIEEWSILVYRAIQIVYLKHLVTNFATQCFTPEGDHQANEYSYTISLDGLCDDARHIACANNLNLNYVFAQARALEVLCVEVFSMAALREKL